MTFDKFCFWCCIVLTTMFFSANIWLIFKSFDAIPQALGTYAVIVLIGGAIAKFKPEIKHAILTLATALISAIPIVW